MNKLINPFNQIGKKNLYEKMLTVVVEGNIGAGKTTFLDQFRHLYGSKIKIYKEPVELWRNVRGHNLLNKFYEDPKKWSLSFQTYVQLTMAQIHEESAIKEEGSVIKMMERSLFSARYCFVENLFKLGYLTDVEYNILDEWFISLQKEIKIDFIIYLKTSPENCYQRIKSRGRPEESSITLDYLKSLHSLHEDWLGDGGKNHFIVPAPLYIVNANPSKEDFLNIAEKLSNEIFSSEIKQALIN